MLELEYVRGKYHDGTTAIKAYDKKDGFPYCSVTVNLGYYGMTPEEKNHVFIPTYKLPEEALETIKRDLVKSVIRTVPIGYGEGIEVELKDNWKEICPEFR